VNDDIRLSVAVENSARRRQCVRCISSGKIVVEKETEFVVLTVWASKTQSMKVTSTAD
jgi:hypothetical protein